MKEERKSEYPEKTPGNELQKMPEITQKSSSIWWPERVLVIFFHFYNTQKKEKRDSCVCTCALPLVKCMHLLTDCILLSSLALSLSLPPPSPVSGLFCPSLHYTCLASVKQTHHQSTTTPSPPQCPLCPTTSTIQPLISPPWHLALPFIYHQFQLS